MSHPRAEYQSRRAAREASLELARKRGSRLADARGAVFLLGVVLLVWAVRSESVSAAWVLIPVAAFLVLVVLHNRCKRVEEHLGRAVAYYRRAIDRLDGKWQGLGNPGSQYAPPKHLYADDLDLFGEASLFELICQARTRMGEETLAAWLLEPASPEEIAQRQAAQQELREKLDLREDLAILPEQVRKKLNPAVLGGWIGRRAELSGRGPRWMAVIVPVLMIASLSPALLGKPTYGLPWLVFFAGGLIWFLLRNRIEAVVRIAEGMSHHLALLSQVLKRLQQEQFNSPMLSRLRDRLETEQGTPSLQIDRLGRLIDAYNTATRNMMVVPVSIGLLLPVWIALAMERWRRTIGPEAKIWLETVGQFETLLSLSGYGYERPDDIFATISDKGPLIDAGGLGHPLLPEAKCRRNDVRLDADRPMLLISGSNMSGKSTMLRTVGVNVALALAGGPVRARRLTVSPLTVGATINVRDSLQEGQSHFYAEMARLRDVVNSLGGDRPVLFLLDEIMHGTNSHDRRIGAEAVLRKLIDDGAVGLVTTHDLSLAEIVEQLDGRAENAHFEDQLIDGQMVFDYQMRKGIVQKSNALDVMRSLGLDV